MIYNSNGNNAPYQTGGNAKVNKQLKALEEAINNVSGALTNYVGTDPSEINGMVGDALTELRDDVDGLQTVAVNDGRRIDLLELTVGDLPVKVQTVDVKAEKGDFHTILNGKYLFQNGYQTASNAYICKLTKGSVVWATDGTNGVLVDYTDSDAWVAKAHVAENKKFTISENGVLMFSEASSFSVYVIGNVFDTTVEAEGDVTDILTGITIGGTLYAALARDYDFNNVNIDNLTINNKLELTDNANFTAPTATIDDLHTDHITSGDIIVDDASVKNLVAAKRNIKDGLNSSIIIDAHPTTDKVFIGVNKFTGTYSIRLDKVINNVNQTLFTATIVWNGNNPIVNYWENQSIATRDYLYSITLTDDRLYFCTQGDGTLYYAYDAMSDASAPMTFPSMPEPQDDIICEYITAYEERTVFLGNHGQEPGVDILGELKADIIHLPEGISADNMILDGYLEVGGEATFHDKVNIEGDTKAKKVEAEELYGTMLGINDTGTKTDYEHNYLSANASGVNIGVNTTLDGNLTQTGNQNITGDETITGDVTLTGDLTQTGNQNVNGEVVISEKETINSLEKTVDDGYYEYYDYYVYEPTGTLIDKNFQVVENPIGTKISESTISIKSTVPLYYQDNGYHYRYTEGKNRCVRMERQPGFFGLIDPNTNPDDYTNYYEIDENGVVQEITWPGINYFINGSSRRNCVLTDNNESVLEKNTCYVLNGNNGYWYKGFSSNKVTDEDTINTLESRNSSSPRIIAWLEVWEIIWSYYYLEGDSYRLETIPPESLSAWHNSTAAVYSTSNVDVTFTYQRYRSDFIPGANPNHTYDANEEVLTVKGNEKVTRDLHVQGYIFQDDYKFAKLPNIKSDSIELGDGVVRKIAKNAQSGVVSYDATNGKFVTSDDLTLPGDLVVDGQITARKDLSISGDLYVNGTEHINDVETIQSSDDYFVLRHNKSTALGANEHAGIAVHNYALDKTATLTTDNQGIWRVADNSETSTTYTGVSYYNGDYFTGLTQTATTVIDGIKTAYDQDELDECALYNGSSYYHFDGINWYGVSLVDNVLTVGAKVEDADVITALEALTRNDLVYYRSLTVTVINEVQNQPLLTRAEEADLNNGDILAWDATNKKAVHLVRPTLSNQALKSKITNGVVSYEWGNSGSAGVAFVGTRAQYDVAKLIPEGQDGFIPPNSIVKITDEDDYVTGENR
jgi:hypothetical protein